MSTKEKYSFIQNSNTIDRKLYKYYSNVDYAIDTIRKRRIHLDNPRDFNDPFEAVFGCSHYSQLPTRKPRNEILLNVQKYIASVANISTSWVYREMVNAITVYLLKEGVTTDQILCPISDTIEMIYKGFGVVEFTFEDFCDAIDEGFLVSGSFLRVECKMSCFSEVHDSILMWSYYANSHKGICIEYDLERLDLRKSLNQQIINNLSKVHYSPIRSDNWDIVNEESALNFLSSKADVWAHEHEWRIICETKEEYLPLDCISNIYIGANFSTKEAKYQRLIKAVNTYEALKIHKCKLNSEKYQIDFHEIYDSYAHTFMEREKINKKLVVNIA